MGRMAQLDLDGEGIAFDTETGDSFLVNEAGLSLLKSFQAGRGQEEAVVLLAEEYQVSREQALRDVLDFHERLRTLGIL